MTIAHRFGDRRESDVRLVLMPALALFAACAGATNQPAEIHHAQGEATTLAACAYRALRDDRTVRFTPMPDGTAEVARIITPCGLAGCNAPRPMWIADFEPEAPGHTRIQFRAMPALVPPTYSGSIGPAVETCGRSAS